MNSRKYIESTHYYCIFILSTNVRYIKNHMVYILNFKKKLYITTFDNNIYFYLRVKTIYKSYTIPTFSIYSIDKQMTIKYYREIHNKIQIQVVYYLYS